MIRLLLMRLLEIVFRSLFSFAWAAAKIGWGWGGTLEFLFRMLGWSYVHLYRYTVQ